MRLIDADELVEKLDEEYRRKGAKQVKDNYMNYIYDAPRVDAKPVVHGRWFSTIVMAKRTCIEDKFDRYQPITCSICEEPAYKKYNYCPNCGAKMDLKEKQ